MKSKLNERMGGQRMILWVLLIISIIAGVAGQTFLKTGANQATIQQGPFQPDVEHAMGLFLNIFVIAGVFCYALSAILYIVVLTKLNVSLAYPLVSLGYVLVALSAWFFLNEEITVLRWAGIALIVAGSVLVGFST